MQLSEKRLALIHFVISISIALIFYQLLFHYNLKSPIGGLNIKETSQSSIYIMIFFVCLETAWILSSLHSRKLVVKLLYLSSIFMLVTSIILDFSIFFYTSGLISGGTETAVTPAEALYFSIYCFVGAGVSTFSAHKDAYGLVSTAAVLGYLLIPLLVSVLFSIIDSQRR